MVADGLVGREVVELDAALQLLVGELRIEAVLLHVLHEYVAVAGVDDLLRTVEVDAGSVGQHHLVALVGLAVSGDGHGHVEHLAVVAGDGLVARQVEAVGIAVEGLHGQCMAGGTLSLHNVVFVDSETFGEVNHDGHAIDILGVFKEHGIDYRLAPHAVGRHAIDADVLRSALSWLAGAAGVVVVAVVCHQCHVLGGDGQRVVATGRYHLAVACPVLECVPRVVVGAEGLLCSLLKLVAALGVEIAATHGVAL